MQPWPGPLCWVFLSPVENPCLGHRCAEKRLCCHTQLLANTQGCACFSLMKWGMFWIFMIFICLFFACVCRFFVLFCFFPLTHSSLPPWFNQKAGKYTLIFVPTEGAVYWEDGRKAGKLIITPLPSHLSALKHLCLRIFQLRDHSCVSQAIDWLLSKGNSPSPSCWQGIGNLIHLPLQLLTPLSLVYVSTAMEGFHLHCFNRKIFNKFKIMSLLSQVLVVWTSTLFKIMSLLTSQDNNTDIDKYL